MFKTGTDENGTSGKAISPILMLLQKLQNVNRENPVIEKEQFSIGDINPVTEAGENAKTKLTAKEEIEIHKNGISVDSENKVAFSELDSEYGEQFSISDNARDDIKKVLSDKNYQGEVRLTDNSPSIMLTQKGVRNLPMLMNASHIRENILTEAEAKKLGLKINPNINYHGLGEDLFIKIIEGLDDVKEAYRGTKNAEKSERRENYFLLISEYKDSEENIVNVPIYINEKGLYNRVFIDTNKLATIFGKEGLRGYLNREIQKKNLVKIKNRNTQTSESTSPINADYEMSASNDSISPDFGIVNRENSVTENEQFSIGDITPVTEAENKELEKHFGTTGNFNVAGYLLTDGKLLDFSGKHWGDTTSRTRQVDHRDVQEVLNRGNNGIDDMVSMIGSGNIRLMPENGGINLAVYPNEKQRRILSSYINYMLNTNGEVVIDYDAVGGDTVYSKVYGKTATSRQILNDIRNYFNGARPSELMSFHTDEQFAIPEQKSVDKNELDRYNRRGWADNLLSVEDHSLVKQKLEEAFVGKQHHRLKDGTKVIEVNNKILFVSGTFKSPVIDFVVAFNSENSTINELNKAIIIGEDEYGNYTKQDLEMWEQVSRELYSEALFTAYSRKDYTSRSVEDLKTRRRATLPESFKSFGYSGRFTIRNGIYVEDESGVPGGNEKRGSVTEEVQSSIPEKSSDGQKLTEGQRRYFRNSKVRDENGNLKVMYHGTSRGGFTVFDTYGSNYGLFGTGAY